MNSTRQLTIVLHQIRAEYCESSGLRLSLHQIQRLWKLAPHESGLVITTLVESGFLRPAKDGTFCRCE